MTLIQKKSEIVLQQIEYSGTVWALSHNDPEPLIEHSIKKLQDYGIKKEDIQDSRCSR